ncbi:acyloxyacyl hydrolase [Nitratireductor sp. XY-223]|uniref:acyloxyacyl hydrolase n=1 Tax=Nitratireductor sp. XY-223 TaxID=2561926 RepID=UPI00145AEAA4|nr:acyloxyacyl hydrolase [Nitratireductor sp. XY-223]
MFGVAYASDDAFLSRVEIGKHAKDWEVRFGGGAYDTGPASPNHFSGAVINGEILLPSPDILAALGSPRPVIGADIAISDNPIHVVYTGLNWQVHLTRWLYIGFTGGGSWNSSQVTTDPVSGATKDLGSDWLFHLQASVGVDITEDILVEVFYNHYSNASLTDFNIGLESVGGRMGYRF